VRDQIAAVSEHYQIVASWR